MAAGDGKLILVTGGAGYIGSHCCLELLAVGYDVVVVRPHACAEVVLDLVHSFLHKEDLRATASILLVIVP
jgi:UDP-glucose 4-epimerase